MLEFLYTISHKLTLGFIFSGYMPPEYLIDGTVSTKIDVFGFGVLLLEIISGKMNHGSYDTEHPLNLLGLVS